MVMSVDASTLAALQNARTLGIVPRYFLRIVGKNRDTGANEPIQIWTGELPLTADTIDPNSGATLSRTYQAGASWLVIPTIPSTLSLEARSIRMKFSRLPAPVMNAIRLYDPKMGSVQIHRGLLDPNSMGLVSPAYCIFNGFINRAPIKVGPAGDEGTVELEITSHARFLTKTNGAKFSDEFLKRRSGGTDRFGRYLDVAGLWKVYWGEDDKPIHERAAPKREKFLK